MNPLRAVPISPPPPRGFVLLTVLIVVLLASMLAVSLLFAVRAEVTAQATAEQQEQAWWAALGGVARAIEVARSSVHGPPDGADGAAALQHQWVADDGADRWYFSVYCAPDAASGDLRFGLTDEAGKLSLRHTDPAWLARLPGLDPALVQALVPDAARTNLPVLVRTNLASNPAGVGTATDAGGTGELVPGPLLEASLDEVFVGAGLGLALLHGEDANFNLRLDPNEDDGESSPPLDDRNGLLDGGLQQWLTVDAYDLNVDAEGRPRVNLNDARADLASVGLPKSAVDYVAARLRAGKPFQHPVELLLAEEALPDATGKAVPQKSGIGADELVNVLDRCTTTDDPRLPGLINLNTAPRAVLAVLPALGESGADAVVASRPGLSMAERRTPAWLLQRGLVSPDQFKVLAPRLTTRSYQFRFHCLGYAVPSGRYRVLAATVDVAVEPARILRLQDLTRFGFPMPLELLETAGF